MSDRALATVIITCLIIAGSAFFGGYQYGQVRGHTNGYQVGKSLHLKNVKNQEANVNDQIKQAYIRGCTAAALETLTRLGFSTRTDDFDLNLSCAQDALNSLPWYSLD
jgi:hypothetical protein